MADTDDPTVQKIKGAFNQLVDDCQTQVFLAISVDKDFMVNFASYGVDDADAINLLEHMIAYFKGNDQDELKEKDNDNGTKNRTIH